MNLLAQSSLAAVALRALYLDPRLWGIKVLNWDRLTVILSTGFAVGAVSVWVTPRWVHRTRRLRPPILKMVTAFAVLAALAFVVSIVETRNSLRDAGNTGYLVNELLAPSVGSHPLLGYRATYSNLWGYALLPFVRSGLDGPSVVAIALTIGTLLTLVGTYFLLRFSASSRPAFIGTVAVVAMTATGRIPVVVPTSRGELNLVNDAFSYHQIMPLRFLGVVIMANLAMLGSRRPTRNVALVLGFVGALVAINNPDFGTLAVLAAVVSSAFWGTRNVSVASWLRAWVRTCLRIAAGGLSAIFLLTLACLILAGKFPQWWTMTSGTRSYAAGVIALPMGDLFDFHLVVIGTYIIAALVGTASMVATSVSSPRRPDDLALQFLGIFGLGSLVYYANRPVISTLVAAQFFTWSLCLVLLWVRIARSATETRFASIVGLFVIAAITFTASSQIVSPPDIGSELNRLRYGRTDTDMQLQIEPDLVSVVKHHAPAGSQVAVIAPWPKSIAEAAGVRDVVPFSTMPFVTYPELDELMATLDAHRSATVFIRESYPYPEVPERLTRSGYSVIASESGVLVLRRDS